jgi:5'-nucleotidase (lipoprotein e(P4) family)
MIKMSLKGIIISIMGLTMLVSCASKEDQIIESPSDEVNSQGQGMNAVLWHQTSAEYKALCYQTYNLAKIQLKSRLQNHAFPYEKAPAVVMDLDETVVDNSFFNAQLILDNEPFSKEKWKQWSDLMKAGEVPGAIKFIQYARSLGVKVIFISNRRAIELSNTMKNLENLGLSNLDSNDFYLRTKEGSKASRRSKVALDYDILMLFGDNLADFTELFDKKSISTRANLVVSLELEFGSHFMVLPNVLYGEWEGALYDYQYDWSIEQKDSIRKSTLQGF